MRAPTWVLVSFCVLIPNLTWAQEGAAAVQTRRVVVEDFERGVARWSTADDIKPQGPATRCQIVSFRGGAPGSGRRSARISFTAAQSGWARVWLPVKPQEWGDIGGGLSLGLWLRGDGSQEQVRLGLRVRDPANQQEEVYTQTLRLSGTQWERFSLRHFGFQTARGEPLGAADLAHVVAVEFSKSGGWKAFSFRVDGLAVEVATRQGPVVAPEGTAVPVSKTLDLRPDFSKAGLPTLAQVGLNLGRPPTIVDSTNPDVTSWALAVVSDLAPCVVRVQLTDYYDARTEQYNLKLVQEHIGWIEKANCKPLICVSVPRVPTADAQTKARVYAGFVKAVTDLSVQGAAEKGVRYYEIFDEPLVQGLFADVSRLVTAYNKMAELILASDPRAKVGGPGFASARRDQMEPFLRGAQRLDFLSFHFYGAHSAVAETKALFRAAMETRTSDLPDQLSFQQVRQLVKSVRKDAPPVFVTEFALNSARDRHGASADERVTTALGAAWVAATVICGAPYVDKLIHFKLAGGGWGMLSDSGAPEPPYWAAWLLRNYAGRGSIRRQAFVLDDFTVAATFKTGTAENLVIAYAGADAVRVRVRPTGLPALKQVRDRRISDTDSQWTGKTLTTAGNQDLVLDGPGVVVLQYIPQ